MTFETSRPAAARPRSALQPVPQESTVDRVTVELRRSILSGILAPGEPFSITDLAEQLGVSHIPVREALRRLEGQGLLRLRAGRSGIVAPIDAEELRAVYRLRILLEADLAGRSRKMLSNDDLARMRDALRRYGDEAHHPDTGLTRHREFHLALLAPAASSWDLRILELLWQVSERYIRLVFSNELLDEAEAARLVEAHQPLVDLAARGTADELRRAVRAHLERNERHILDVIANVGTPAPVEEPKRRRRSR